MGNPIAAPPEVPTDVTARLEALLREADPLVVSDAQRAELLAREAASLARSVRDARREGHALALLGGVYFFTSRYTDAKATFNEVLTRARAAGDAILEARGLNGLGISVQVLGEHAEAIEYFLESLRVAQESGNEIGRARVLGNLGVLRVELGEFDQALEVHLQAIDIGRRLQDHVVESSGTVNAVVDYYHLRRHDEALALAARHLPRVREFGIRQHEVVMQAHVTLSLVETGQAEAAARLATDTLTLAQDVQDHEYIAILHMGLGRAQHALGSLDEAEHNYQEALHVARGRELRMTERDVLGCLSKLSASRGDWRAAYEHATAYHALERALHAQDVDRRTKVISRQMQVELLKRDAEVERLRNIELARANAALSAAQERLAYRATHDALTGLANRAHFHAEFERALQQPDGEHTGVLFIDLDRFKFVNDTFGHDIGDELLKQVAERLRGAVRAGDLVARIGGDEFTVLLTHLRTSEDAERVALKVLQILREPWTVREDDLPVTASIGVAVAPHHGTDVVTLQKHADAAMYRAKRAGKNAVRM